MPGHTIRGRLRWVFWVWSSALAESLENRPNPFLDEIQKKDGGRVMRVLSKIDKLLCWRM